MPFVSELWVAGVGAGLEEQKMKRSLTALVAAASVAAVLAGSAGDASAQRRHHGGAVAAGIIGGLAAGALIGGAIANSGPVYAAPAPVYVAPPPPVYYRPAPGYVVYDEYYATAPYRCEDGYWARRPVAYNAYGEPVRWSRPRYFCP